MVAEDVEESKTAGKTRDGTKRARHYCKLLAKITSGRIRPLKIGLEKRRGGADLDQLRGYKHVYMP